MRETLEDALVSSEPLSLTFVARQLRCDLKDLRRHFPSLCEAIDMRYRQRFDIEQIRQSLQMALSGHHETLFLKELARQNGCTTQFLRANFPGLCEQIVASNRAELKKRHEERIAIICTQVRQAISTLHEEGIYPSSTRIQKLLKDPTVLLRKEAYETWRAMLQELGYYSIDPN